MRAIIEPIGQTLMASVANGHVNLLLGTWKLKSYVVTTDAGVTSTPFGDKPTGYLSYSADGRMYAIGTANGRLVPKAIAPTEEEQLALHMTMFAYAGTYTVDAEKVTHHVDISWNGTWTATDQVRFYELKGNTLVITASGMGPAGVVENRFTLVWEKVERFR
jgi:hypothetical protein